MMAIHSKMSVSRYLICVRGWKSLRHDGNSGRVFFLTPQRTIEIETDVRLSGIDTPEKRPLKKKRDGTLRSAKSRSNEKYAAARSRLALLELLRANELEFTVSAPKIGKYAGRIVAGVSIDGVDAAQFLIENGNALPYDGGRKVELDWDNLSDGKMKDSRQQE